MASQIEISIPTTTTSDTSKPYTIYNISLRLPLRSYHIQKRYSEFVTLHSAITDEASSSPPALLPPKSWFTRTTSSPELTEERRKGLEKYLKTVNEHPDDKWRNTSAWRTFFNLPSSATNPKPGPALNLRAAVAGSRAPTTDPQIWLDHHRDLKAQLHEARLNLTRRDQATTTQLQHETSAQAKKCLVRAGTMITALDSSLKELGSSRYAGSKLGEGELRRRRDLVAAAQKEREGLENLLSAMAAKSALDRQVANAESKSELLNRNTAGAPSQQQTRNGKPLGGGRVLGKETEKTRELDNQGVLQLQQQTMQEQDEDVDLIGKAVARQKELAIQIQEELEVQNDLLNLVDEDVTRVQGKVDIARKRIGQIS